MITEEPPAGPGLFAPFPSAHPWTVPPTHTSCPEALQGHSLERCEGAGRTSGWCMWLNPGRLLYKPWRFCWAGGDPLPFRLPITSPRSSLLFIRAKSSSLKCLPLSLVLPARLFTGASLWTSPCQGCSVPKPSPLRWLSLPGLFLHLVLPSYLDFLSNTYPNL